MNAPVFTYWPPAGVCPLDAPAPPEHELVDAQFFAAVAAIHPGALVAPAPTTDPALAGRNTQEGTR